MFSLIKKLLLYIVIFITLGCQGYSEFKKITPRRMALTINDARIGAAEIKDWHVGIERDKTISKGIQVKLKFPRIRREDLEYMAKIQGINSWLIRVSRMLPTRPPEVMGLLYVPLLVPRSKKQVTSTFRAKQMKFAYFRIFYAAAAISPRFEESHCPVFNHQKYLDDVDIVDGPLTSRTMVINTSERARLSRKVEKFGYRPLVFNGGSSLRGRYVVDLALYNFKTKMKQSSFIRIPDEVNAPFEGSKIIKECADFVMPDKRPGYDNPVRQFKWKKKDRFIK